MTALELAVVWWLIDKATGGIFSEYVKRLWFATIHRQKDKSEQLRNELRSVVYSYSELENSSRDLIKLNDDLVRELSRVKVENASLRAKLIASEASRANPAPPPTPLAPGNS